MKILCLNGAGILRVIRDLSNHLNTNVQLAHIYFVRALTLLGAGVVTLAWNGKP
ncbi:hypothetical protein [Undibacterium parvum]|uniref:hypothetical protein n=1 Tax=Undibacterium parvum TaxID=401471 RepID=UPI0013009A4E|nr:hypothetical protein [Undibacterium parvum]